MPWTPMGNRGGGSRAAHVAKSEQRGGRAPPAFAVEGASTLGAAGSCASGASSLGSGARGHFDSAIEENPLGT